METIDIRIKHPKHSDRPAERPPSVPWLVRNDAQGNPRKSSQPIVAPETGTTPIVCIGPDPRDATIFPVFRRNPSTSGAEYPCGAGPFPGSRVPKSNRSESVVKREAAYPVGGFLSRGESPESLGKMGRMEKGEWVYNAKNPLSGSQGGNPDFGDAEIDQNAGHVDEHRHEGAGGQGRIESQCAKNAGEHRADHGAP